MSTEAQDAVDVHSRAVGGELACLQALARRCHPAYSEFICWPSQETLARRCHVTKRTIKRYIATLRDMGELRTERRGNRIYYTICLPRASEQEIAALLDGEGTGLAPPTSGDRVDTTQGDRVDTTEGTGLTPSGDIRGTPIEKIERNRKDDRNGRTPSQQLVSLARVDRTPSPLPPSPASDVWRRMRDSMRPDMSEQQAVSWMTGVQASWLPDGTLQLITRSTYAAQMLATRYSERITLAAEEATGYGVDVEIRAMTEVRNGPTAATT